MGGFQRNTTKDRYSPMRNCASEACEARARNPYSRSWLWIPGLRLAAHPGMTIGESGAASSRFRGLRHRRKGLAFGGETLEQRRRFQRGIVGLLGVIRQPVGDMLEANLVGIEHRAAAIDRPAIAIEPDHVDVARTRRDAFFEDARTLVDHRIHHVLEDLFVPDDALLAAEPLH